jgi:hypothetical protein
MKEITLAKLASRNLYLDEDEFCCYKTLFKNIDRNRKFEKRTK